MEAGDERKFHYGKMLLAASECSHLCQEPTPCKTLHRHYRHH